MVVLSAEVVSCMCHAANLTVRSPGIIATGLPAADVAMLYREWTATDLIEVRTRNTLF